MRPRPMHRLRLAARPPPAIPPPDPQPRVPIRVKRRPSPAERPGLQHLPLQMRPVPLHPLPAPLLSERPRQGQEAPLFPPAAPRTPARREGAAPGRIPRTQRGHQMLLRLLQSAAETAGTGGGMARGGGESVEGGFDGVGRQLAACRGANEQTSASG